MDDKVNLLHIKHIHLENSMVIQGVYNTETLEKFINTVHQMHNITTPNERLFASTLGTSFTWYINKNGAHHYAINTFCIQEH